MLSKYGLFTRGSIGYEVFFRVLIFSTIVTTTLTAINFFIDYKTEISKLNSTISDIEKSSLSPISKALWNFDKDQIESHINGLTNLNHLLKVTVYNEKQEKYVESQKRFEVNSFIQDTTYPLKINDNGKIIKIGELKTKITKYFVYKELLQRLMIFFITQGFKTFFVSIFIMFICLNLIGRPVINISQFLHKISVGDLKKLPEKFWISQPNSEIGFLGRKINIFIEKIKERDDLNIEKLEESNEKMEETQKIAKIGSWEYDITKDTFYWSKQMFSFFPQEFKEEKLTLEKITTIIHSDDVHLWQDTFGQSLKNGKLFTVQFRVVNNKKISWAEVIGEGIYNPQNRLLCLAGTCQDITEKRINEQKFLEQERRAENSARLASIGLLASGVAHEINNPLTIFNMSNRAIIKLLKNQNIEPKEKILEKLELQSNCVERISNIVNGLRTLARKDEQLFVLIDSHEQIKVTLDLLKEIFDKSDISFEVDLKAEHSFFSGDISNFQQILINIFTNARDAQVEGRSLKITISTKNTNTKLFISISDNGIGIPTEQQGKIFDSFYTTKDVGKGTGLGLSLTHAFIINMKGKIDVKSQEGIGTTFTISFPLAERDKVSKNKIKRRKQVFKFLSGNVLIVEDEKKLREMVVEFVRNIGFTVSEASNGIEALEKVKENHFDILITDLKMPKMGGVDLIYEIRKEDNDLKILVLTGLLSVDLVKDNNIRYLVDSYLNKPFKEDVLYRELEKLTIKK